MTDEIDLGKCSVADLRAVLSQSECSILDSFHTDHIKLFSRAQCWQSEIVWSIQLILGPCEPAKIKYQVYQAISGNCPKILKVDELCSLLFPIFDIESELFLEKITEAIREVEEDPRALLDMEAESWEEFEVFNYPINIKWLESRDSDYLKEAAAVWRGYLGIEIHASKEKSKVRNNPEWERRVQELHKRYPKLNHTGICKKLVSELGVSEGTIRRRTTNPKPRNKQK